MGAVGHSGPLLYFMGHLGGPGGMRVVLWALSTLAPGKSGQSGGVTYKMEALLLFLLLLPLLCLPCHHAFFIFHLVF